MSQPSAIRSILDAEFRANPNYRLVLYDRLVPTEQSELAELAEDGSFYGVLMPQPDSGLPAKAVDQETALLWLTLQEPGPVPQYVRRKFGANCNQAISDLVLREVIQVLVAREFLSGAAARAVFFETQLTACSPSGYLAELSESALRYAQALVVNDEALLGVRLYLFNTLPLTPVWGRRLPTPQAVIAWLKAKPDREGEQVLSRHWHSIHPAQSGGGWWMWRRKDGAGLESQKQLSAYKLYISPRPEALPDIWGRIVRTLSKSNVHAFKLGKDAHGVLRPDKLVVYLPDFESLAKVAESLRSELAGCPAQGVPFTAPIDPNGLLSWGMDPPSHASSNWDLRRESWRHWITTQLARALVEARRAGEGQLGTEPWQYALARLRVAEVDTSNWTPKQTIWRNT